jgi:hypothetical protein
MNQEANMFSTIPEAESTPTVFARIRTGLGPWVPVAVLVAWAVFASATLASLVAPASL